MPERDTKLFEILIGQVVKNGGVDVALGKAFRVLGHAERFEPVRNLPHRALFASMFDDYTMEWLNKHGYLRWDQRGQGEAIIAAVNALIGRQR